MADHWIDRLSDYLDDELDAAERAQLETHLQACSGCGLALEQLREVVQRARGLQDRVPSHDLWSGIAARIENAETTAPPVVVDLQQFGARKKLHVSFSVPQLIAAGIMLMLVSGASVWIALSSAQKANVSPIENRAVATRAAGTSADDADPVAALSEDSNGITPADAGATATPADMRQAVSGRAARGPAATPRTRSGQALPLVRNASAAPSPDRQYDTAVSDLQTVLREGRAQLDPRTIRALEDNLRVIDQAIAAARTALAGDSANVYLNEHLARNMQQKLELLRRATAIVSGQS